MRTRALISLLALTLLAGVSSACLVTGPDGSVHDCRTVQVRKRVWSPRLHRHVRRTVSEVRCTLVSGPTTTTTTTTTTVPGPLYAQVAGTSVSTCVRGSGGVHCWGTNTYGSLGTGDTNSSLVAVPTPGLEGSTALASGYRGSCALSGDGTVKCWGRNGGGQADPTDAGNDVLSPRTVAGVAGAQKIASGYNDSCAVRTDGTVVCWGNNTDNQLLTGDVTDTGPVTIPGITDAIDITAGGSFMCALRTGGTVACWGLNNVGQLGDGTTGGAGQPVTQVSGLTDAVAVVAGDYHACAVRTGGSVVCWGFNNVGQLGNGTNAPSTTPVAVTGLAGVTQLAAGAFHNCALTSGGSVWCWGRNSEGESGSAGGGYRNEPVEVTGAAGASAIGAGRFHSCAIDAAGETVSCWGQNTDGQLGDGTTTDSYLPVQVLFPV